MKYIEHIKFLYKSNNQHGIHSPFVYDIVTKCFYDKKKYSEYLEISKIAEDSYSQKKAQLLFRLSQYFESSSSILCPSVNQNVIQCILQIANPKIRIFKGQDSDLKSAIMTTDCIYMDTNEASCETEFDRLVPFIGNDTYIFCDNITDSEATKARWLKLKNSPIARITINTYRFGLIFFRREQVEQDFFIRL